MKNSRHKFGFTLIEVMVALVVLSLVLVGAISMVHQYADQRAHMSNKLFSTQVAWNALLDQYRYTEGWVDNSERGSKPLKGQAEQYGQNWRWKVEIEPAMGKDMYRYEVQVSREGSDRISSSLALYVIEEGL